MSREPHLKCPITSIDVGGPTQLLAVPSGNAPDKKSCAALAFALGAELICSVGTAADFFTDTRTGTSSFLRGLGTRNSPETF